MRYKIRIYTYTYSSITLQILYYLSFKQNQQKKHDLKKSTFYLVLLVFILEIVKELFLKMKFCELNSTLCNL